MYQSIVLLFTNLLFLLGRYIDARQWARLKLRKPPIAIKNLYGEEKVEKSYKYSLDKLFLSIISSIQGQVTENIFILCNAYSWLWNISSRWSEYFNGSEMTASLLFVGILGTLMMLLGIPTNIYSTFFIEKRHGFNNQDAASFIQDIVKSWIISLILGLPFVFGLLKVINMCGAHFVLIAWLFTFVTQICLILIMPTFIQPLFNKFELLKEGELKDRIEQLAKRLSFPLKEVYVMDGSKRSSHSNAYFFGLFGSKRIVLYDTFIKQATQDEICAILGHELGHWACNHLWKRLIFTQVQMVLIFVALNRLIHNASFFESFGFMASQPRTHSTGARMAR